MLVFKKLLAFLRKDFLIETSYKFNFIYQIGSVIFSVLTLFFVSKVVGSRGLILFKNYGTKEYFPFAVVGMALIDYMWVSFKSFSGKLRFLQIIGTLEFMFTTKTKVPAIIGFSSIYSFVWTSLRISLYFVFAIALHGNFLQNTNVFSLAIVFILTITVFISIGLIGAAITLLIKAPDPAVSLIGGVFFLLGGILYPVEVLPDFLAKVSDWLPITVSAKAIRLAIFQGKSVSELGMETFVLLGYIVLLFPMAVFLINRTFKHLIKEGSTGHY